MILKLGRNKSKPDRRKLRLARYLSPALPPAPAACDYTSAVTVPWGMMANDVVGNCIIAGAGHCEMGWTANGKGIYVPPDADIMAAYTAITGYNPADPNTDVGTDPVTALKYWRKHGISGHTIGAWAAINAARPEEVQQSIYLFGSAYIALALPAAAQNLDVWDVPTGQPLTGDWAQNSWGGHMVEAPAYNMDGVQVVTWGALKQVTWRFLAAYADEPFAVLSSDLLNGSGKCPAGFDLPTLQTDLQAVSA